MSSTLSPLGSVSKWLEDPCQNSAIGNCFICQNLPSPLFFIWGEFGISSFPCSIAVSSLRCLDRRSCPSSSDTGWIQGAQPPLTPHPHSRHPLPAPSFLLGSLACARARKSPKRGFFGRKGAGTQQIPFSPGRTWGCPCTSHPLQSLDARTGWMPLRGDRGEGPSNPTETSFPHCHSSPWTCCPPVGLMPPSPPRGHSLLIPNPGRGDTARAAAPQLSSAHRRTFKHCLNPFKTCSDPINSAYLNSN